MKEDNDDDDDANARDYDNNCDDDGDAAADDDDSGDDEEDDGDHGNIIFSDDYFLKFGLNVFKEKHWPKILTDEPLTSSSSFRSKSSRPVILDR